MSVRVWWFGPTVRGSAVVASHVQGFVLREEDDGGSAGGSEGG